jgi:hypothetical protein
MKPWTHQFRKLWPVDGHDYRQVDVWSFEKVSKALPLVNNREWAKRNWAMDIYMDLADVFYSHQPFHHPVCPAPFTSSFLSALLQARAPAMQKYLVEGPSNWELRSFGG